MSGVNVFEKYYKEYDGWFEEHPAVYESELEAVRRIVPENGEGVEIGVGTGRFAVPLGVKIGIEPSHSMAKIAKERGIDSISGNAEELPLKDCKFDYTLFVTTICFLDSIYRALSESNRILKPGGSIILGFIDRESPIGKDYYKRRDVNKFYREAKFYSVAEILDILRETEFEDFDILQTLFNPVDSITKREPVKKGYGSGSFIVIKAFKKVNRL